LFEGDAPVRALRLALPRTDGVLALMWTLGLAADDAATPIFTEEVNPYEAFALAGILGTPCTHACVSVCVSVCVFVFVCVCVYECVYVGG
jgi:hypothetical protein